MDTSGHDTIIRRTFTACGQVQGVGFRPFIYRLAHELALTGTVCNTSEGVAISVQGRRMAVERFPVLLREQLPPLARLTALSCADAAIVPGEEAFTILASHGHHGHSVLISPDVGICPDCLADMRDPGNRRWRYPFTNCTNCGPRYTITRSIPYDRPTTSMACFPLCPECAREYTDPLDRRFHAQPIACPVCGPRVWFLEGAGSTPGAATLPTPDTTRDAVGRCARALLEGRVVAIRGLGGFQLACDARDEAAVARLRERKRRPHKAFALMAADVPAIRAFCHVSADEEARLRAPARAALVLRRRDGGDADPAGRLAEGLAPDTGTLGVMLPTTPLHVLLFDLLDELCRERERPAPVLVMTSGNVSGDPICLGNREAITRLGHIADCFLLHDRDILCRVDDSVEALLPPAEEGGEPVPVSFRRARGHVPSPIALPDLGSGACVFGAGAGLKVTCCFLRGDEAFVGQHIGDLENAATAAFYEEATSHLGALLEVTPDLVVADLHPDFPSSRYAEGLARELGVPLLRLQHHAAHAMSVLAEHGRMEPALALTLDGTGLGPDGTVWGGELLLASLGDASWRRVGHLAPFALPGGDAAVREPWRVALTLAGDDPCLRARWMEAKGFAARAVAEMAARRVNTPATSSCGRLFDAVAAQLGLCEETTYEGQAAIRLETAAWRAAVAGLPYAAPPADTPPVPDPALDTDRQLVLESRALFLRAAAVARAAGTDAAALDFHESLARGLTRMVRMAADRCGVRAVALTGGVLLNRFMALRLRELLTAAGIEPLTQRELPPGDGGVSLGQAAWGRRSLALGRV